MDDEFIEFQDFVEDYISKNILNSLSYFWPTQALEIYSGRLIIK